MLQKHYFSVLGEGRSYTSLGDPSDPSQQGRMIMDCCMNLPLLYWASEETGNQKYKKLLRLIFKMQQII